MKNLLILAMIVMLVVAFSPLVKAQSTAVTTITINAAATTLTATNSDGGVDDVLRGVTYTVEYDAYAGASTVAPNNNGEAPNGDVGVDITGDPSSSVVVEMTLPDILEGVGGTSMAIRFPSSGPGAGVRVETGGFFNPNVTNTFNLGTAGTLGLRLGYIFTVPAEITIAGEMYQGQIFTNVYYTGI